MVEQQSLNVVAKWIKEVNNTEAYEDILREVIVIPDDDEDDDIEVSTRDPGQSKVNERRPHNPLRTVGGGEIQPRPPDYVTSQGQQSRYDSPDALERDRPQVLGHGQYIPQPHQQDSLKAQRVGLRRHQLWEQALDRRIKEPDTYRIIREAPQDHPPLALRTIEAQHSSNVSPQVSLRQGDYLQQSHLASGLQQSSRPNSTLRIHTQIPETEYGALPQPQNPQVSLSHFIVFTNVESFC